MGETKNRTALGPGTAKAVVSALKSIGTKPFLFDSPVAYNSKRNTPEGYLELAHSRGFTPEFIGCPVKVSNESIRLNGEITEYEMCSDLDDADGVCFLSHVKGHPCTGFGGAIKNIGMGAMTRETKKRIHDGGKPVLSCGCIQCMKCVDMCPTGNIRLNEDHPEFDRSYCIGCSNCALVCEENAISPAVDYFDCMLAEATALALSRFSKVIFINCLVNITSLCDCVSNSGKILCGDVGYIIGENICSVEKASLDLILRTAGRDIFFDQHHISAAGHIDRLQAQLENDGDYSFRYTD